MTRKKKLWCRVADFGNLVAIFSPSEEIEEEARRSRRRWKWWWGVYAVHQYTSCTLILFYSFYNLLIELQHLMPSFFLPLTMFVWNCWNIFRVVTSTVAKSRLCNWPHPQLSHHHQSTWICATLNTLRWEKDTCCLYLSFWDKKKTHFCLESKTIHINVFICKGDLDRLVNESSISLHIRHPTYAGYPQFQRQLKSKCDVMVIISIAIVITIIPKSHDSGQEEIRRWTKWRRLW